MGRIRHIPSRSPQRCAKLKLARQSWRLSASLACTRTPGTGWFILGGPLIGGQDVGKRHRRIAPCRTRKGLSHKAPSRLREKSGAGAPAGLQIVRPS